MSANTTVARPYAKAIFEMALDKHQLPEWSTCLNMLSELTQHHEVRAFLHNSETSTQEHADLLVSLVQHIAPNASALDLTQVVQLLAVNKRINVLPQIAIQFNYLRAEEEKTLVVQVTSFKALTPQQEKRLIEALSRRLDRRVSLTVSTDSTLLGGAVIHANDLVIDGSVRGKLTTLGAELAA